MKNSKQQKPYWEMNAKELAEATKQFDRPIPESKTRSLTKQERAQFERMQRAPYCSVFVTRRHDGEIFLRIDPVLLRRSSRYAAAHNMSLSQVINKSLKGMLAIVE